jgi:hypothetical protein
LLCAWTLAAAQSVAMAASNGVALLIGFSPARANRIALRILQPGYRQPADGHLTSVLHMNMLG